MIINKQRSIYAICGFLLALLAVFVVLETAQARRQWVDYGDGRYHSFDQRICKDGIELALAYVPDQNIPDPMTNPVPLIFSTSNLNNQFEIKNWFLLTNEPLTFVSGGVTKIATHSGQYTVNWPVNLKPGDKVFYESDDPALAGTIQNGVIENCLVATPQPNIPDTLYVEGAGSGTDQIFVPYNFIIEDINIHLNLSDQPTAPVPQDITAILTSPKNKKITLMAQIGGSTPSAMAPIFDQESFYSIVNGSVPFTQTTYIPQGPGNLSELYGKDAKGTWTLQIVDASAPPNSQFSWTLDILGQRLFRSYVPTMFSKPVDAPDLVVHEIALATNGIQIALYNQGAEPVEDTFWVDLYIDPQTPPTQVNQTWQSLGTYGAVWGIDASALPLNPGEFLIIETGDKYYRSELSNLPLILLPDTELFAQVDSANDLTNYGAVLETHEIMGTDYNNIKGFTALTTLSNVNVQQHQIQPKAISATLTPRPE